MDTPIIPLDLANPPLDGVNVIEASAGTGKTYAICAIYLHLLLEKNIPIENILVVTFTVAATEELKGRIRSMLKKTVDAFTKKEIISNDKDADFLRSLWERYGRRSDAFDILKTALRNFDRAAIYTIHGFCQRMLIDNAFESSSLFDTELAADVNILAEAVAEDFWRKKMYAAPESIARYTLKVGFFPNALAELAKKRPLDPQCSLVPDIPAPDEKAIEQQYVRLIALFNELHQIWNHSKEEIVGLIETAIAEKKLNGTKYRKNHMPGRIEKLEQFFSDNDPFSENNIKQIAYFSSSILNEKTTAINHRFCDLLDEFILLQGILLSALNNYIISLKKLFVQTLEEQLSAHRILKNIRTFDDLLTSIHRALNGDPNSPLACRIRERFSAALIDEFQDTDPLQYEIFTIVFRKFCPLFMIGDPKQAIYKFRGADIFAYLRASSDCDRKLTLLKNYRSHPGLIMAINTIFGSPLPAERPFVLQGISYNNIEASTNIEAVELAKRLPSASPLTIWFVNEENEKDGTVNKSDLDKLIPQLIVSEIQKLIAHGDSTGEKISPGTMAVLVRKNKQSRIVAEALRRYGIPCVTYGTESVLETQEALDLERIISAIAEPANKGLIVAALATDLLGKTATVISQIVQNEQTLSEIIAQFKRYRELWERHGFIAMHRTLFQDFAISSRLASLTDGERRLTNIFHIAELIHKAEREQRLGIDGILKWFSENKALEIDEMKLRLETDEHAVKILTIHKSKGLEFPIVFCPFLYDSPRISKDELIYHDTSNNVRTVFDLSPDDEKQSIALLEELSESVRLMYVALTRAKARCYTLWGSINQSHFSAPMYVFHNHRIDFHTFFTERKNNKDLKISVDEILHDLQELEKSSSGAIRVQIVSNEDIQLTTNNYREKSDQIELSCREFSKSEIRPAWHLSSFSSLIARAKEDYSEKTDDAIDEKKIVSPTAGEHSIYEFPQGARAGLFIHDVFERIDFQCPATDESRLLITKLLRKHGFEETWADVIIETVKSVLTHPLQSKNHTFALCQLEPPMRAHELEFYFPASSISARRIAEIIMQNYSSRLDRDSFALSRLGINETQGFLRGFIDVVFTINGKWYLADWKSNHLGHGEDAYRKEKLESAMASHFYHLQYHIYAVALHRHLQRTLSGYNYDKHFGGVFYFFVRGIHQKQHDSGIFFDRPSKDTINMLDAYFRRSIA